MALTPTTPPPFPSVPKAPGVPPVLRQAGAIENTVVAVASDAITVVKQLFGLGPTWGIFSPKTGAAVFASDSVIAVDYRQEWRIADYPIERGGFSSYNKVKTPFDIRVSFSFSGNQGLLGSLIPGGALLSLIPGFSGSDSRRTMLQMLDAAIARLDLVSVVTPEAQYPLVNIIHYDYRREPHQGATLIRVDVWCQEVRPAPAPAFSKSPDNPSTDPLQNPGNAPPAGSGGGDKTAATGGGDGQKTQDPAGAAKTDGGTTQPQQQGTGAPGGQTGPAKPGGTSGPFQAGSGQDLGGTGQTSQTVPILDSTGKPMTTTSGGVEHPLGGSQVAPPGQSMGDYLAGMAKNGYSPVYQNGTIDHYVYTPPR